MSKEEKEQFEALYQFVKKEILEYDDNQSIPSNIVLSLKGLRTGKAVENRSQKDKANYSYDVILIAFKICKSKIKNAVFGKSFKSEVSKFVYIKKIVENELNDVYLRLQKAEQSTKKIESINTNMIQHEGAEYKPNSDKINDKLKNIW